MDKFKILLVDDEPEILSALKRTMRREGYQFFTADSVAAAIAVLEKEHIDLLITDYRMPGKTGDKLLEHAREHYPDIVRILLTGYSSANRAEEFVENGLAQNLVNKPWNNAELCNLIAKYSKKETAMQDEIK